MNEQQLTEKQIEKIALISETLYILNNNRRSVNQEDLLQLLTIKEYLEGGANEVVKMWVEKRITDKDDYHSLISYFRSAYSVVCRMIETNFEIKQDYQIPIKSS